MYGVSETSCYQTTLSSLWWCPVMSWDMALISYATAGFQKELLQYAEALKKETSGPQIEKRQRNDSWPWWSSRSLILIIIMVLLIFWTVLFIVCWIVFMMFIMFVRFVMIVFIFSILLFWSLMFFIIAVFVCFTHLLRQKGKKAWTDAAWTLGSRGAISEKFRI